MSKSRATFVVPGDLNTPTGGYVYARKILPLLAERLDLQICSVAASFPFPSAQDLDDAEQAFLRHDGETDVFFCDGLAYSAMPVERFARLRAPLVALVHHPLGLEEGLTFLEADKLLASERAALHMAQHVVVPSPAIARTLAKLFDILPAKITIAEPGILRGVKATGSAAGEPCHIVSVGSLTPRKGFDILIKALNKMRHLPWRLIIAGADDRSSETAAALHALIDDLSLRERISFAGNLDEPAVSALYSSGDVFALASLYEGYGMAFAEAQAHGLPVVASGEGAVRDTVPDESGIFCAAYDVEAFAAALRKMVTDADFRKSKAEGAWAHGQSLPSWPSSAQIIADVLINVAKSKALNG